MTFPAYSPLNDSQISSRRSLGGSGAYRITGTSPITGPFYAVTASGSGDMTIASITWVGSGSPDTSWNNTVVAKGTTLLFGDRPAASITLSGGNGWGYKD